MAELGQDETIHALTETDAGATIRLRGYQDGPSPTDWTDAVEVVDDGDVTTLYEDEGIMPTVVYNQMVEPFLDEDEE